MNKLYAVILLLLVVSAKAQDTKEVKLLFQEAEEHLLYEEYDYALPKFKKLTELGLDNSNINFSIGICYLNMPGMVENSIPYLEKASQNVSKNYMEGNYKEDKAPEEAYFYLAKAYRLTRNYDKSIDVYKKYRAELSPTDVYYLDFCDLQVRTCEQAKKLEAKPIVFTQKEADFSIAEECYNPAMSGDGNSVVFTSMQQVKDDYTGEKLWFEIINYSTKTAVGWSEPKDLSIQLASDGYYSTTFLNYTGDYMLCYRDDYGNGNIYFSVLEGKQWSKLEKLPKQISSRGNETHASLTRDGNTMYFTSDREGGIGGKDIYRVSKDGSGKWGKPENLGEGINTQFEEETPFINADGTILYFASEAHTSMGGYDIFKSTLNSDGTWSQPQNLGYPVNTGRDDLFYYPLEDGSALMSGVSDEGKWRIYHIEYPRYLPQPDTEPVEEEVQVTEPEPIIVDVKNNLQEIEPVVESVSQPEPESVVESVPVIETEPVIEVPKVILPSEYELHGTLSLQDNSMLNTSFYIHVAKSDGEVIASLSPSVSTGEFKTVLKPGTYKLTAYGTGYEAASKNVVIDPNQQNPEVVAFLSMRPIQVSNGEYYTIKNVFFEYNSVVLNRDAQEELERLAVLMKKNPSLYIEVSGHTDSHGSEDYNLRLSAKRSRAVIDYLQGRGIETSRFVAKSMGTEYYIAINENPDGSDNPEGRRLNRRAEMKIIKSNSDKITVENIFVPDELRYKDQLTYTILLMETDKPLPSTYFSKSGENINNVWMFQTASGYLYTVGQFKEQAEALPIMNMVVDAGFPKARVISSIEYHELVQKSSNFYKSKMNESDKTVYTIQLAALGTKAPAGRFKNIGDVDEVKGEDGYYRYIWGEYIGKTSARQALDEVVAKGYTDAFIVSIEKFRN